MIIVDMIGTAEFESMKYLRRDLKSKIGVSKHYIQVLYFSIKKLTIFLKNAVSTFIVTT